MPAVEGLYLTENLALKGEKLESTQQTRLFAPFISQIEAGIEEARLGDEEAARKRRAEESKEERSRRRKQERKARPRRVFFED